MIAGKVKFSEAINSMCEFGNFSLSMALRIAGSISASVRIEDGGDKVCIFGYHWIDL